MLYRKSKEIQDTTKLAVHTENFAQPPPNVFLLATDTFFQSCRAHPTQVPLGMFLVYTLENPQWIGPWNFQEIGRNISLPPRLNGVGFAITRVDRTHANLEHATHSLDGGSLNI